MSADPDIRDAMIKTLCDEWAEDHSHLQRLCRDAGCTELEVDGDSYFVPGIMDLANLLRDRMLEFQQANHARPDP